MHGRQYTAARFKDLLARHGAQLKHEPARQLLRQRPRGIVLEPPQNHCIAYYNAERRHSALAYQSPNRFETQL